MSQEQFIEIPAKLKRYIRQIWLVDGGTENSFLNFADGCSGMVFQQAETGMIAGGKTLQIPTTYVFGQTINPVVLSAPKDCRIIGLIFHPHILKPVFRFDAKEITDTCLDVKLLPAIPRINITEQLWNTGTAEKQLEILLTWFGYLVEKNKAEPDRGMEYAAGRIMQLNGHVSLKRLRTELNLSERTFERRFGQHVGISSSLLSGIAQFQASLKQLKNGKFEKLSDIAYDNGYADQSHFIRSFKKFTGVSPLQFYKQLNGDADKFLYDVS